MASAIEVASLFGVLALRDSMSPGLESAQRNARGFGGALGGLSSQVQGLGALMLTAGAAGGAALGGLAATGLSEFARLERGMNEVFTLMPGITADAMDNMTAQVEGFAIQFGTLPEEVVPALYQSLSAGVPQDNVFDFLATANKAAVGGVTELETAVDGISSVVNAYGSDIIDATRASDLMFTTVRLGKTDFGQLSASLFNVIPTASSLGIAFEDVSAGLATITAAGTPTSVATTQMRQLFVELGDSGTGVGAIFQELTGKSFKAFIAEGNNVADALGVLQTHADASNLDLNQLFGSVEAGNAALGLTGPNAARFASSLEEMADAAGATDAAFEQMDNGIGRSMDRFNASFRVMVGNIGNLLAPVVTPAIDIMTTFFNIISAGLEDGEFMSDWLTHLPGFLRPVGEVVGRVAAGVWAFFGAIERAGTWAESNGVSIFQMFFTTFEDGSNFIGGIFRAMGFAEERAYELGRGINSAVASITAGFGMVRDAVVSVMSPVWDFISQHVQLKDVLMAGAIAIGAVVIPAIIGFVAPIIATVALLVGGVTLLRTAWENDFLGIQTAVGLFAGWFTGTAMPAVTNFVTNTAIPAMQRFFNYMSGVWDSVSPGLSALGGWFTESALPTVVNFVRDTALPMAQGFFNFLMGVWDLVSPALLAIGTWFVSDALPGIVSFVQDTALPAAEGFFNFIGGIWDLVSAGLGLFADWFTTTGLQNISIAITAGRDLVQALVDRVVGIWSDTEGPLEGFKNGINAVFGWINDNVIQPIIGAIDGVVDAIQDAKNRFDTLSSAGDDARAIADGLRGGDFTFGEVAGAFGREISGLFRDNGGPGQAGQAYAIGKGAQPELFVPATNGQFIPNIDRVIEQGIAAGQSSGAGGNVVINVTQLPGEDGESLAERVAQKVRNRGLVMG